MNIFPTGIEKAATLAAIIRRSHQDVARMFAITKANTPRHPSFCTADWVRADFQRGETYFLGTVGDTDAGCVAFAQPDPDTAYLNRLSVLPEHRHQGVGAALVGHVVDYAGSRGAHVVSIGIIATHAILKSWYANLGFVAKDTRCFAHLPFDVTYMHYEL